MRQSDLTVMSQAAIANKIQNSIEQLIERWSLAVRDDPRIQSDAKLSTPELIDHVPSVIEEICCLIRKSEIPGISNSDEARVNVYTRINQGYEGRDLVRELSLLRITLLDCLWESPSPGFDVDDRHRASTILNLYLDEEMRYAISVFCNLPPSPGAPIAN